MRTYRTIDAHMHVVEGRAEAVWQNADRYGFEMLNVLACPCLFGAQNNLEVALVKALRPGRAYAFGGLMHGQGIETAADYGDQARALYEAGFDGLKFIETKPDTMRALGRPLDSPCFEEVFALAEEKQWPILWHVGDPETFWDVNTAPRFAVENGWCYDDPSFPTLGALYAQAEAVLRRHPRLKVCFAHFYFTSDDFAHAQRMMETWPGVRFDLTPGSEMFPNFAQSSAAWRDFFVTHSDRILFGTDFTDEPQHDMYEHLLRMIDGTLAGRGTFTVWDSVCGGMELPPEALSRIYAVNFEDFAGTAPRPFVREGLTRVCAQAAAHEPDRTQACERLLAEIEGQGGSV